VAMRFEKSEWRALLRQFPQRPGAWRVLATNLVPLAGVLLLGWSAGVATLGFFLDALLTAAVLTFVMVVHALRETAPHVRGHSRVLGILMLWIFLVPFIALPVFVGGMFALGFGGVSLAEGWALLQVDRSVQIGFSALALFHLATAVQLVRRDDGRAVRDEVREGFGLMCFKVLVLAVIGANVGVVFALLGFVGQLLVLVLIAAILTIAEVYRAEVLAAMGVHRKFHESCEGGAPSSEPAPTQRAATPPAAAFAESAPGPARRNGKRRRGRHGKSRSPS
jgi:hypothetical protein